MPYCDRNITAILLERETRTIVNFFKLIFVVNNVFLLIIIVRTFEFYRFINIKHKKFKKFNEKTKKTIDVIVASNNFFNKFFFDNRSIKKNRFIFVDLIEFFVE